MNLNEIINKQKKYLFNDENSNIENRINNLKTLKKSLKNNMDKLLEAMHIDLGKSFYESFLTEYQLVLGELDYFINNLYGLTEIERVGTSLNIIPGAGRLIKKPYGIVLVQSPWNYPLQLSLLPTIGAIAAGNTVILKTSGKVPNLNKVIEEIANTLPDELLYFANDFSHDEVLEEKYDFYFFTGSKRIGKKIYKIAAENMAPAVLELGGKSPCIVEKSANIKDAAKKIAWGKFTNSGQTCVAPDYVLVHKSKKDELISRLSKEIDEKYNDKDSLTNIITKEKVKELASFVEGRDDVIGGEFNIEEKVFMPTLLTNAKYDDSIMKDEIFGPVLPIIEYENIDEIIRYIRENPTPLALYMFSKDDKIINKIMHSVEFGGGCINDVIVHVSESKMPFGGMGESGIGGYHGKYSIDIFTHNAGVVQSPTGFSNFLRYPPHTKGKFSILKKVLG